MEFTREELYAEIGLQPEIAQKLYILGDRMDLSRIDHYLVQMMDGKTARQAYQQLKELFLEDEDHLRMLYCQLECARRLFGRYQEKQIGRTVYRETMKCFTRFIEECRKKNGRMFFDRGWWTYRQVSMSLFRIGTLEYEFKEYGGEKVIALHIPSDADLSAESVDESMEQADLFFRTHYSDYVYDRYTCGSWLLSPALRQFLTPGSNISSFQDRFTVVEEDREDQEYIEWLFQVPADTDHQELPSKTSLQRKVKEWMIHGGKVGSAFGVMEKHSKNDER